MCLIHLYIITLLILEIQIDDKQIHLYFACFFWSQRMIMDLNLSRRSSETRLSCRCWCDDPSFWWLLFSVHDWYICCIFQFWRKSILIRIWGMMDPKSFRLTSRNRENLDYKAMLVFGMMLLCSCLQLYCYCLHGIFIKKGFFVYSLRITVKCNLRVSAFNCVRLIPKERRGRWLVVKVKKMNLDYGEESEGSSYCSRVCQIPLNGFRMTMTMSMKT